MLVPIISRDQSNDTLLIFIQKILLEKKNGCLYGRRRISIYNKYQLIKYIQLQYNRLTLHLFLGKYKLMQFDKRELLSIIINVAKSKKVVLQNWIFGLQEASLGCTKKIMFGFAFSLGSIEISKIYVLTFFVSIQRLSIHMDQIDMSAIKLQNGSKKQSNYVLAQASSSSQKQLRRQGKLSPIKPRQKMPTIYRHRRQFESNLSEPPLWPKDNSFLKSRLDSDIQLERQTMLIKTGLTSPDNPEWMTINYDDYRRSNYKGSPKHSYKQERFYDIFNNSKMVHQGRNEDSYFVKMQSYTIDRPREVDLSVLRRTLQVSQLLHGEVTGKVGATDYRDFSIPRPQLKVGSKSFVDTYSPF